MPQVSQNAYKLFEDFASRIKSLALTMKSGNVENQGPISCSFINFFTLYPSRLQNICKQSFKFYCRSLFISFIWWPWTNPVIWCFLKIMLHCKNSLKGFLLANYIMVSFYQIQGKKQFIKQVLPKVFNCFGYKTTDLKEFEKCYE